MAENSVSMTPTGEQDSETRDVSEASFQVSIKGPGITVDKKVSDSVALQLVAALMSPTIGADTLQPFHPAGRSKPTTVTAPQPMSDAVSIGEYLESLEARRNPDKIVAIGLYVKEYQASDTFVKDDIKRYFRQAGETPPANLSRDMRAALTARWIAPSAESDAESGSYWVTKKGVQAAAQHFSIEVQKAAPTKRVTRRRTNKPNGADR